MKLILLRTVIFILLLTGIAPVTQAQLSPGDLLFTGVNTFDDDTDGNTQDDAFSFVMLRDCPANTTIYFTDLGWTGSDFQSLYCGTGSQTDGIIVWNSGNDVIKAGQPVVITCKYKPHATIGTATGTAATRASANKEYISLGLAGDQLFAFTGGAPFITVLAGLNINRSTWETSLDPCEFTSSKSMLPGSLTAAQVPNITAVNGRYNCNVAIASSTAKLQALLLNTANWAMDNTMTAPAPTAFDLIKTPPCNLSIVKAGFAGILFVNNQAAVPGDGSSWGSPLPELRDALNAATDPANGIRQIWVAKGTYKPSTTDPNQSFVLVPNIPVYGGFAGVEGTPGSRNIGANPVILSGDIDNDDILTNGIALTSSNINGNNSYHVVTSNGGNVTLDGVIVTGGKTIASLSNPHGAGFYTGASGNVTIKNTRFYGNKGAGAGGAAYFPATATATISNSSFYGNEALTNEAAITAYNNLTITNVTVAGNISIGIRQSGGQLNAYNSIVTNNTAVDVFPSGGTTNYSYSVISSMYYVNSTPSQPVSDIGFTNLATGDLTLKVTSQAINRGDPQTNDISYPLQVDFRDLAGQIRIKNTAIDAGAFEYQSQTQNLMFFPMMSVTYGDNDVTPTTTTTGDGGITYTSDNAAVATIVAGKIRNKGAGTARITASASATNGYDANSISQTFTVKQKVITLTADPKTRPYGTPNPTFTGTYSGFVYNEDASVIRGTPGYMTMATSTSPAGTYSINPMVATLLSADNYSFAGAPGTLTITQIAQTINFTVPAEVPYGTPVMLTKQTDGGLDIFYTVTGPATVSGNVITLTGLGTVTVKAEQFGDVNHTAATPVTQSFTVTKAMLTVTANDKARGYKQANPAPDYTITGFMNGENATVVSGTPNMLIGADVNSDAGTYPITITKGSLTATNYDFTVVPGTLTVNKLPQTITFAALTNKIYGDGPVTLNATSDAGLPVSYTVAGPASLSGNVLTITGAGPITVTATQGGDVNYDAANAVPNAFSVAKALLQLTADNKSREYGQTNPALTYTYNGFVNGEDDAVLTGTVNLSTTAVLSSLPGTYPIGFSAVTSSPNYIITPTGGTLTVITAQQTITFPAITDKTYGDAAFTLAATTSSNLPVTYSGSGPVTISGNTVTITGAGTVTITAKQAGDGNYDPAQQVTQTFQINKAVLTVTAVNKTKTYKQVNPTLDYSFSGFKNGDNASAYSGIPDISTTATVSSDAGTYPITITRGNLGAVNYDFSFVDGTLTINKASQNITFAALANKTYGDASITLNANSDAGLPVSYTVSGPASINGNVLSITGAGTVTVTADQAGDVNYNAATPVSQSFNVAKANLTIKADNKSREYYQNNPPLTYSYSGFVNGDDASVVTGTITPTTPADLFSLPGGYPIMPNIAASASNYLILPANGTLTITTAQQSITFPAISGKTYGDAAFTLNATTTSSLPVTYSVISGPATISGTTVTITGSGDVTIGADQAGNSNYNPATQATQTFRVNKATLTVTANNKTKAYKQPNPLMDYTFTGFVGTDNSNVINGAAMTSTTADVNSPTGAYPINVSLGNLSANNYDFRFTAGTLTVTPTGQQITFAAIPNKQYGDAAFALNASSDAGLPVTFTVTGGPATINGSTLTITGTGMVTVTATQTGDANYNAATPVSQSFNVTKAPLQVKADDKQRAFGAANPLLTYTITGFVYSDNSGVVTGSPVLSTTANAASSAGTYPIRVTAGTLSATNYTFTLTDGTLTVGPADQSISFPVISDKTYGDAAFTLNATASSTLPVSYTVVSGPATISGNTVTLTGAGVVTVAVNQAGNNEFKPAPQATRTFNVAKAALTVTAKNDTRTYNGTAYTGGNDVDYTGFVNGDNTGRLTGTVTYSGNAQGAVDAGAYSITPAGLNSNDYTLTYVNGTLTITKASQQITFTAPANKNQGDAPFTLTATSTSGLPVSFSSNNTPVIAVTGNTASVGNAGTVVITASQAGNNNYEPATAVTQTIVVTAYQPPVISAQGNIVFCQGGSVTLQSTVAPVYEWYRNNTLIAGAGNRTLTVSESGSYTVKAIYPDNSGLMSTAMTVTVNPLPTGDLQVNGNTTISKGERVTLVASGGTSYSWEPATGLSDATAAAPVARPAATTTYRVTIMNAAGCSVSKDVTINVKEDYKLEPNNILTPNGDGINDVWVVKNIDMYPQNEVKIFDRTGRLIYRQRGYTNNWKGTVNGQPLAEGTYYFIIELGDNKPLFKGFITIVHEN
ncbi:T9SS type B sorting domain-containing protein [Chitinophaga sp. G-6-1-13]|uniref:T9SS type B sorting domain-containing protein n=1 Tax=Chitinophaga fulva TaxID=2728842 RepID=A0A848GMU3_9BACT|nr:MBG domain-containing protein [Chitinophaga fulva]NML39935.1 T9SS type B sorting domain-containing protein [Chitinophaga fulva]